MPAPTTRLRLLSFAGLAVEPGKYCTIDNEVSYRAHLALDYGEVERIICFRKALDSRSGPR